MNRAALIAQVGLRCGIPTTDTVGTALMDDAVNEAIHHVETWGGGDWPWLYDEVETATTANQEYLLFSAITPNIGDAVRSVRSVEWLAATDTWEPLQRITKRELRKAYQGYSASSQIDHYAVDGNRILFAPTPNAALDVRIAVIVTEPDLDSDSDTPLLPAIHHRVLVAHAAALVLEDLQRWKEAKVQAERAEAALTRMPGVVRAHTGPGRIARTGL